MPEYRLSPFQFFLLALSLYVLGALAANVLFELPPRVEHLFGLMDYVVCVFFFIDFCIRFHRAPNKWRYMRWGWIDLLSSIPAGWLQAARLARVVQVLRILRAARSLNVVRRMLFRDRAEGVLASAATATVLLVVFGALTVLLVESPDPDSPINTAPEALWWAIVTVTTVGYGDYYPVTTLGRVIAIMLMVCGVGLFGSVAAYVGSLFLDDQDESDAQRQRATRRMLRHVVAQVDTLQTELEETRAELRACRAEIRAALAMRSPDLGASSEPSDPSGQARQGSSDD